MRQMRRVLYSFQTNGGIHSVNEKPEGKLLQFPEPKPEKKITDIVFKEIESPGLSFKIEIIEEE